MRVISLLRSPQAWGWIALFALSLILRFYHLTGWILSYDESHWLLYARQPDLLLHAGQKITARPDGLLGYLGVLSTALSGDNELAMRFWPAGLGALSIFPMARFVSIWMESERAGWWAAVTLAVLPLHVYLSAQAIPDVITIFFVLCALVFFARLVKGSTRAGHFIGLGIWLSLAILTKQTALFFWLFLAVIAPIFLPNRDQWWRFYGVILLAIVPWIFLTVVIKRAGSSLAFFEQPTVRGDFALSFTRISQQGELFLKFFNVALVGVALGIWAAWKSQRLWLVWLIPFLLIGVTSYFRVKERELLYLIPSVGFFLGLCSDQIRNRVARSTIMGGVCAILLGGTLVGVPVASLGNSMCERSSALLARPAGWPSQAASRWLLAQTEPGETVLLTTLGFVDPVVLNLRKQGRKVVGLQDHWELLRDPANQIRYVVFVDDYQAYASQFGQYADQHFSRPAEAGFVGYAIYDCRRNGQFVAYPDAYNSPEFYHQQGNDRYKQKNFALAIESYQTALQLNPKLLPARKNLMMVYLMTDRKQEAWQVGQEVLKSDPNDLQTNINLALLDLALDRVPEGIAQCERNIRLQISPAISYGILGQLHEKQGDLIAAQKAYGVSWSLDPKNEVTRRLLTDLQRKLDHPSPLP